MSQDEIINTLKSLVEIPSVSSDKNHDKDVDGFHHINMGKLMLNKSSLIPCTAEGCFRLLKYHNIDDISGQAPPVMYYYIY